MPTCVVLMAVPDARTARHLHGALGRFGAGAGSAEVQRVLAGAAHPPVTLYTTPDPKRAQALAEVLRASGAEVELQEVAGAPAAPPTATPPPDPPPPRRSLGAQLPDIDPRAAAVSATVLIALGTLIWGISAWESPGARLPAIGGDAGSIETALGGGGAGGGGGGGLAGGGDAGGSGGSGGDAIRISVQDGGGGSGSTDPAAGGGGAGASGVAGQPGGDAGGGGTTAAGGGEALSVTIRAAGGGARAPEGGGKGTEGPEASGAPGGGGATAATTPGAANQQVAVKVDAAGGGAPLPSGVAPSSTTPSAAATPSAAGTAGPAASAGTGGAQARVSPETAGGARPGGAPKSGAAQARGSPETPASARSGAVPQSGAVAPGPSVPSDPHAPVAAAAGRAAGGPDTPADLDEEIVGTEAPAEEDGADWLPALGRRARTGLVAIAAAAGAFVLAQLVRRRQDRSWRRIIAGTLVAGTASAGLLLPVASEVPAPDVPPGVASEISEAPALENPEAPAPTPPTRTRRGPFERVVRGANQQRGGAGCPPGRPFAGLVCEIKAMGPVSVAGPGGLAAGDPGEDAEALAAMLEAGAMPGPAEATGALSPELDEGAPGPAAAAPGFPSEAPAAAPATSAPVPAPVRALPVKTAVAPSPPRLAPARIPTRDIVMAVASGIILGGLLGAIFRRPAE